MYKNVFLRFFRKRLEIGTWNHVLPHLINVLVPRRIMWMLNSLSHLKAEICPFQLFTWRGSKGVHKILVKISQKKVKPLVFRALRSVMRIEQLTPALSWGPRSGAGSRLEIIILDQRPRCITWYVCDRPITYFWHITYILTTYYALRGCILYFY